MKILLLDNFDSFTYNLYQYAAQFANVDVVRNDGLTLADAAQYDAFILSPGPGLPKDAGIMPKLIRQYYMSKPMLGVCLGMQAIAEAFGGKLINLEKVYHGIKRPVTITKPSDSLFTGIPTIFNAGRYHSWAVDMDHLPSGIEITAVDNDGIAMALTHKTFPVKGVQFHPESIMTEYGLKLVANFILQGSEIWG